MSNGMDAEFESFLKKRFPELDTARRNPLQRRLAGFGATLFGRRELDSDTQSYVAGHYVTLFFLIPIPIGAYRVMEMGRDRWYVLGRVPMSSTEWSPRSLILGSLRGALQGRAWVGAGLALAVLAKVAPTFW